MISNRFDTVSRLFASRRAALAPASIQATRMPDSKHGPAMLFVQSFQSGSIVPNDSVEGRYTVTLDHGLGQTIYFSDRPDRIVGSTPTASFLDGLGFSNDNPPNAAILTSNGDGDTTLAVIELFAPLYDASTATLTYDVQVLDHWQDETDRGFRETPVDLDVLSTTFGTTYLFIDDCADEDMTCVNYNSGEVVGIIPNADFDGWCYSWWPAARCLPCQPWDPSYQTATWYWDEACENRFCGGGRRECWADNFH